MSDEKSSSGVDSEGEGEGEGDGDGMKEWIINKLNIFPINKHSSLRWKKIIKENNEETKNISNNIDEIEEKKENKEEDEIEF